MHTCQNNSPQWVQHLHLFSPQGDADPAHIQVGAPLRRPAESLHDAAAGLQGARPPLPPRRRRHPHLLLPGLLRGEGGIRPGACRLQGANCDLNLNQAKVVQIILLRFEQYFQHLLLFIISGSMYSHKTVLQLMSLITSHH